MQPDKMISVLAEEEPLFLPNLLARLARQGLIKTIILYKPRQRIAKKLSALRNILGALGFRGCLGHFVSILKCRAANVLFRNKYYSIGKVARNFNIPLVRIDDLYGKECFDALSGKDIVFAQVGEKIDPPLLQRAVFWNKHCGLLPSYKGVYPVFWAMLNRESRLGVTIHAMDAGFDTGVILSQAAVKNDFTDLFGAYSRLYDIAVGLLIGLCHDKPAQRTAENLPDSYYSFPRKNDRKKFLESYTFGPAFRMHQDV